MLTTVISIPIPLACSFSGSTAPGQRRHHAFGGGEVAAEGEQAEDQHAVAERGHQQDAVDDEEQRVAGEQHRHLADPVGELAEGDRQAP